VSIDNPNAGRGLGTTLLALQRTAVRGADVISMIDDEYAGEVFAPVASDVQVWQLKVLQNSKAVKQ